MEVNRGSDLLDSGSMGSLHDLLLRLLGLDDLPVGDGLLGLLDCSAIGLLLDGFLGHGLLNPGSLGLGGCGSRGFGSGGSLCSGWGLGGRRCLGFTSLS